MAIDAVSSSTSAYTPQAQTQIRAERPEPAQPRQQVEQQERPEQAEQQRKPPPVVNLQGQMTGTVINTTA